MKLCQKTLCSVIWDIVYIPKTYREIEHELSAVGFYVSRRRIRRTLKLLCDRDYCWRKGNHFASCLYPNIYGSDRKTYHEISTRMFNDDALAE